MASPHTMLNNFAHTTSDVFTDNQNGGANTAFRLNKILKNISYFADSVKKIDNVNDKYTLLNQFCNEEINLRSLAHQLQSKGMNLPMVEVLNGLENCLNCVFQTIFQMVLECE